MTEFEKEFTLFCSKRCEINCNRVKLARGERRAEVIFKCPIVQFDKHIAEKKGIEVDIYGAVLNITKSMMYKKLQIM